MTDAEPTRLDRLRNHADALEIQLEAATGAAYAALSGRYVECLRQIEELEGRAPAEASALDEIAAKREERKAKGKTTRRRPVRNGEAREGS